MKEIYKVNKRNVYLPVGTVHKLYNALGLELGTAKHYLIWGQV